MTYQLRQYQTDLISKIAASWYAQGNRRVMAQASCGSGKTIVLASIVDEFVKQNLRCLVLAHRTELINQAVEKLENVVNEPCGVIKAGIRANYDRCVQVGSVQSMKSRLDKLPEFDLIIIDECHRTQAQSYKTVLDRYPNAKVLGVTATPIRLDGKGFRDIYDDLICCEATTSDLIEMGALSQYKYYACEKPMSVLGLKKRGGDFKAEEIVQQNPIEIVANQVIESYKRHLLGKQAIVFATSVPHSIAIAEALRDSGIRAHHLDGMSTSDERASVMALFCNREIDILTNCGLFDEGVDIPALDGVIVARPTASLSRYIQMTARPLRPCEGKERAVIIDLADNYERHGMPDDDRDWTLDGIPKKPKERKTSKRERNQITDEVETVSLFDTGTEYVEIAGKTVVLTEELREWMRLADEIIAKGIDRGFKAGWAAHSMMASDIQPPLEAWKYLGKKLGYHHQWAFYKHQEWAAK